MTTKYTAVKSALTNPSLFPCGKPFATKDVIARLVTLKIIKPGDALSLYTALAGLFRKAGYQPIGKGNATKWVRPVPAVNVERLEPTTASFGQRMTRVERLLEAICHEWKIEVPA